MEPALHIPVQYEDSTHRYFIESTRYLSATQVVEKFINPFNKQEQAEKFAARNGGTAEYWIEQWDRENQTSQCRGNLIHDSNQVALEGRMLDLFQGIRMPVLGESIADEHPWLSRPDGIYCERKLWHHGYQVAGRPDKLILLTDHGDNDRRYAHIEDYKTNKELKKVSYQFKGSGNYKMMKPPLGHIMDCNWWHYCLQLSLYMFMAEYQGFSPGSMTIIYYPHPTAENPTPEKERHDVPYLKREVLRMLTYLRA